MLYVHLSDLLHTVRFSVYIRYSPVLSSNHDCMDINMNIIQELAVTIDKYVTVIYITTSIINWYFTYRHFIIVKRTNISITRVLSGDIEELDSFMSQLIQKLADSKGFFPYIQFSPGCHPWSQVPKSCHSYLLYWPRLTMIFI